MCEEDYYEMLKMSAMYDDVCILPSVLVTSEWMFDSDTTALIPNHNGVVVDA